MEMLHLMLKYPEVIINLKFVNIPSTTLETRVVNKTTNQSSVEDGAYVGILANDVRRDLDLNEWRQMTDNKILTIKENCKYNMAVDKIIQFSIKPCEFRSIINQVWMYYRWFVVGDTQMTDEEMKSKLSVDIMMSGWVNGLGHSIKVWKKAIPEIIKYIQRINIDDHNNSDDEAITSMCT
eukprot:14113363-Ditylum_brightwellii.AAC.1